MANLWNAGDDGALDTNHASASVAFAGGSTTAEPGTAADAAPAGVNPLAWAPAGTRSANPGPAAPSPLRGAQSGAAPRPLAGSPAMSELVSPIDDDGNPILQVLNREMATTAGPVTPAGDITPLWHRGDDDLLPSGGRTSRRFRLRLR